MAYSASVLLKNVVGNARMTIVSCSADAVSGAVQIAGIGYCFAAQLTPISMGTTTGGAPKVHLNLDATSAAANGSVFISNAVSGDTFYLTVYGRS